MNADVIDVLLVILGWALAGLSGWLVVRQLPGRVLPVRRLGFRRTDGSIDWVCVTPLLIAVIVAGIGCAGLQMSIGTWSYLLFLPVVGALPLAALVHNARVSRGA